MRFNLHYEQHDFPYSNIKQTYIQGKRQAYRNYNKDPIFKKWIKNQGHYMKNKGVENRQ